MLLFPGFLFMRILFPEYRNNIFQSIAVSFSLGISIYIIPLIISYIFHLQWTLFYIFLATEILVLVILFYKKRLKIFNQRSFHFDIYDILIFSAIIVTAIAMFLRGGHFTGDATFHLSSIMKLAENNTIDPYVPLFKDVKVIPYNYAYSLLYGLFAFFHKITGIELKVLWDLSPFIFSIFIWSSLYYLSYRLIQNKEFVLLTFIFFILIALLKKWPAFIWLPYPDVIARYILLPVALGNLMVKFDKKNELYKHTLFTGLIIWSITLIHMYSYFEFFFLGFFYFLLIILLDDDLNYRKQLFFILAVSLIMSLPLLILRLKTTTYTFNIQNISELLTYSGIKYKRFLKSTISLDSVWKLIVFITILFFLLFYSHKFFKKIIQKNPFLNDVKYIFLFLFSRYFLILLFMVKIINVFFSKIISTTYARRFVGYGIYYFYLVFSLLLYLLIKYFRKSKNYSKNYRLYNKIGIIIVCLFLVFAYSNLFRKRINKDRHNYRYIMRDNNIYDYIKENVPIWSVFSSYSYPAFEITSQTPNYVISGVLTHTPPHLSGAAGRYTDNLRILNINIPLSSYFKLLKKYNCSYIMIETDRDYYDSSIDGIRSFKRGFSLISTRIKIEYFPEIFSTIYKDDKYSLFYINLDIDLDEIEDKLQNSLNNIANDFSNGYLIATKLLLLTNNEKYYKLQEYFRNKLIDNKIDIIKLTVYFHKVNYRSNLKFADFPNDFNTFFDHDFYPSLEEKIYLASLHGKNPEDDFQYLIIDFNTIRKIHEINIEWYNYESRPIDFQILTAVDERNFKLIDNISNNTEIIYNKFFKDSLKTKAIKILIKNMGQDKLLIKSISIY